MEHGKKTRENKTPVKIPLKNLKINAMALLALLDTHSISEEQEINSNFLRRPEIAEKISEMPSSDDVISMLEQIRFTFKMKKPEDFCRKYEKLDQIIHEIESFDSNNPEEIIEVVAKALRTGVLFPHPDPYG